MIKNWKSFNEGLFSSKKEKSPLSGSTPKLMSTTKRPSEEEIEKYQKDLEKLKEPIEPKIDSDFLQEVSDRLYGPDSEEYVRALKELNDKFRPRRGKYGKQLYDPSLTQAVAKRQEEIIKSME